MKCYSFENIPRVSCVTDGTIAVTTDPECFFESPHQHDYYELEYISGGEGMQVINGQAFRVKFGDIIFFKLSDVHSYYSIKDLKIINCCFRKDISIDLNLINNDPNASLVFSLSMSSMIEIEQIIYLLQKELEQKREYYREASLNYLNLLLVLLKRNGYLKNVLEPKWSDFIAYLSLNYSNITLQQAADYFYITKNYFCKIFKIKFNVTFLEYINNIKIQKAKHLLLTSDMPITSIYEVVGFPQAKQFYSVFKEHTGVTPLRYRNDAYIKK